MPDRFFQVETRAGQPIFAGGKTITPMARSLRLQISGLPSGLVWNRPTAVVVRSISGQEEVLPVQDVTRQAQLALIAGGLLGALLIWLVLRRSKFNRNQQKEINQ